MKIKLDENLPECLVESLTLLGHDVDTVRMESIAGKNDDIVWRAAQQAERFLVTQDLDFSDIRQFAPGSHHGLMLVRLPTAGRLKLLEQITGAFASGEPETWARCFVVLGEHKMRIQRPS